jgi:hypothetical protein
VPVVAADASVELPTLPNVRTLPALDYDEPTVKVLVADVVATSAALEQTRPGRAQRARGARLFAVGVALGAIAVSFVRGGDGGDSFHLVRAWSASALRSFEHRPLPPVEAPSTAAAAPLPKPCSLTDEDCAALMAPYLAVDPPTASPPAAVIVDAPTIDVNELPMVQEPPPPRPVRVARAIAPRRANPPDTASAPTDDDARMDVAPAALPHPEDALDPPPKPAPHPSKPPPLLDAPSGADTGGPVAAAAPIKT